MPRTWDFALRTESYGLTKPRALAYPMPSGFGAILEPLKCLGTLSLKSCLLLSSVLGVTLRQDLGFPLSP